MGRPDGGAKCSSSMFARQALASRPRAVSESGTPGAITASRRTATRSHDWQRTQSPSPVRSQPSTGPPHVSHLIGVGRTSSDGSPRTLARRSRRPSVSRAMHIRRPVWHRKHRRYHTAPTRPSGSMRWVSPHRRHFLTVPLSASTALFGIRSPIENTCKRRPSYAGSGNRFGAEHHDRIRKSSSTAFRDCGGATRLLPCADVTSRTWQ
jgi:hypothetical protein